MAGQYAKLVNKQFNSPINLYSENNIRDVLDRESQMLSNGAVGINFNNPMVNKSGNLQHSAVLRFLEEEEHRKRGGSQNLKRVAWPPPPEAEGHLEEISPQELGAPQVSSPGLSNSQALSANYQQPSSNIQQGSPHSNYQPRPQSANYQPPYYKPAVHQAPSSPNYQNRSVSPLPPSSPQPSSKQWGSVHSPVAAVNKPKLSIDQNQYQSPSQQYQSPHQQYQSPQQYQTSPPQYQSSPQQNQPSPQQYQNSPQRYSTSPQRYPTSPQQYPTSPQQYQSAPDQYPSYQNDSEPYPPQYRVVSSPSAQHQEYPYQYQTSQQYSPLSQNSAAQYQQQQPHNQGIPHQRQPTPVRYQQSAPPPATITLRSQVPVSQAPAPVYTSQPATATLQGGKNLRGDLKWPPPETKHLMEEENKKRIEIARGPVCRPRKVNRDYSGFFAQHALNSTYPGYKVPPGTQFYARD